MKVITISVQECLDISITLIVLILVIKINCSNTVMSIVNKKTHSPFFKQKYMYMTGKYIQQVYLHINYSILYSCNAFLVVVSTTSSKLHEKTLVIFVAIS